MEAVQTTETLVNSYQSTRRYNPEDSHLHSHRHENLKSYLATMEIRALKWCGLKVFLSEESENISRFYTVSV
jgi:hypothetical protein